MRTVLLATLAACGGNDDAADPPVNCALATADTFVVGLDKPGASGLLDFKLMSADPAPPARNDNTWNIQLSTMTSGGVGNGVAGASLTVSPYMPAHLHDSPIPVVVTDKGGGAYELSPVNLWMPGVWETTIQATSASGSDSAVYTFCISP